MDEYLNAEGSPQIQLAPEIIDKFCERLTRTPVVPSEKLLKQMMRLGNDMRDVYLHVLPQAARRFGELWDENRISYASVQLAMFRIEGFLELVPPPAVTIITQTTRQAVVACVPGDVHTLGAKIAADLLRAKGWDIELKSKSTYSKLMVDIDQSPASVLALSIGSDTAISVLQKIVNTTRVIRPDIKMIVCGALVSEDPATFSNFQVDGVFADYEEAEHFLDQLWSSRDARKI